MANRDAIAPVSLPNDTTKRTTFTEFGCTVYGWPSTGGVIIRPNADLVEMKQLCFDPLQPPKKRFEDEEQEDAFCKELMKIGGKWWASEKRFLSIWFGDWDESQPTEEELKIVWLGWPEEGGLLVLEFENMETPDDIGRLRMAVSMEERCRIMRESFDAKYFEDVNAYIQASGHRAKE